MKLFTLLFLSIFLASCGKPEATPLPENNTLSVQQVTTVAPKELLARPDIEKPTNTNTNTNTNHSSGGVSADVKLLNTKNQSSENTLYRNSEYGFLIQLPNNWSKFKYTATIKRAGAHYIEFSVPTTDTSWSDSATYPYARIFTLKITPNAIWDAYIARCAELVKAGPLNPLSGDACAQDLKGDLTIKRTPVYTVSVLIPQDAPNDINQYFMSMGGSILTADWNLGWVDYLRNNFSTP